MLGRRVVSKICPQRKHTRGIRLQGSSQHLVEEARKSLQVPLYAPKKDIKKAYYRLAKLHHPDMVANHSSKTKIEVERKFREIQQAWEILGCMDEHTWRWHSNQLERKVWSYTHAHVSNVQASRYERTDLTWVEDMYRKWRTDFYNTDGGTKLPKRFYLLATYLAIICGGAASAYYDQRIKKSRASHS